MEARTYKIEELKEMLKKSNKGEVMEFYIYKNKKTGRYDYSICEVVAEEAEAAGYEMTAITFDYWTTVCMVKLMNESKM